jgi:hypothetical protein
VNPGADWDFYPVILRCEFFLSGDYSDL